MARKISGQNDLSNLLARTHSILKEKTNHARHSGGYQQESLKLAAQISIAKAAKQLGLHEPQCYAWRRQSEHARSVSGREANLATENARLKRPPD